MTKTKYWLSLLAISVVLVAGSLAVSPVANADDDDDDDELEFLEIEDVEVKSDGSTQSVHIEVDDDVPKPTGDDYGWAVPTSSGGFIVITTHPTIGDDSEAQPPDEAYHVHFLTAGGGGPCDPLPHATSATLAEPGELKIDDDKIWVTGIPVDGTIGNMAADGTFSFTLFISAPNLCINPVDAFAADDDDDDEDDEDDEDYEDDDD